ncbi:rhombotarget A [Acinetobacter sp. 3657]|uniref:rhombotarget A n=1 Tax=Acinetobacter sp. 3657 TaxID=2817764 RepID=UPI002859B81B|nr:rhombotarget A family protein [Prolinoborus sp. 3657]
MFKRTLACALFAITGHVYAADIQVTTLVDEDKDDAVCSLREAVFFLNNRTKPEYENGYKGCGNKDSSSTILLKRDQEYKLNSPIEIKVAMTISTQASTDFGNKTRGLNNATISVKGQHRLFDIYDGSIENALVIVNLFDLDLKGSANKINSNGGLILNREDLRIEYSRLINGNAISGGAIYNAGILSDTDAKKTAGRITIFNSLLENNKAEQGAVIYSEMPLYSINQSVVRDNEVTSTSSNGAILYSQTGFTDETTPVVLTNRISGLRNTTVFNNKGGYVVNIREGMILNNITMIKNSGGLYLEAPKWKSTVTEGDKITIKENTSAFIANSIITANNKNCVASSTDASVVQSNLTETDCNLNAPAERPNFLIGSQKLLAGSEVEGKCDLPPKDGLLCPYFTPEKQMLGYFKPRLLMSYAQLSDSLIVNKGRIYSDGSSVGLATCERFDQRGKERSIYQELCDLGTVEIIINRDEISIAGKDIKFQEIAKFSLADSLLDGELLDPASCENILGKRSDGSAWQAGCLEIVQTETPSKGKLTLDQEGNVTYIPNGNWHGADKFNLRVMTTTTRFNDVSNYYIQIPTTIFQEPSTNFPSKTVNVSGGSVGISAIFMLFGLIGLRRFKS